MISGRDSAGDEIHLVERRLYAMVEIALPNLIAGAQAFLVGRPIISRFLHRFLNGRQSQPAQCVADGFAGFLRSRFITGALNPLSTCRRWSIRSSRPPGKTNLLGMIYALQRLPIRIFGCLACRQSALRPRDARHCYDTRRTDGVFPYLLIVLFNLRKPCIRNAHCRPTTAPLTTAMISG